MDLKDIYRPVHTNKKEYAFFLEPHGTFSKIDHILDNKANLADTKNWNNPMYLIGSPWFKIRIHQQH